MYIMKCCSLYFQRYNIITLAAKELGFEVQESPISFVVTSDNNKGVQSLENGKGMHVRDTR